MNRYAVWDAKNNRPIVDNKVANPFTGANEPAGTEGYRDGPPAVDSIWINTHAESRYVILQWALRSTVNDVLVHIANHIQEGLYSVTSLQASEYAVTRVCVLLKPIEEFDTAVGKMTNAIQQKLNDLEEENIEAGKDVLDGVFYFNSPDHGLQAYKS